MIYRLSASTIFSERVKTRQLLLSRLPYLVLNRGKQGTYERRAVLLLAVQPPLSGWLNPLTNPLERIVASLDRKRLGQDRWQGRKTGSEAFSIRRLGGRRWRGGRGPMGFEGSPGVRLRDGRAGWKCESSLVIMGGAANGWNGRLEKGQSRQGGDTRASACWRTSKRRYRRSC